MALWSKQVQIVDKDLYDCLKQELRPELHKHLLLSCSYSSKVITFFFYLAITGSVITAPACPCKLHVQ